MNRAEKEDFVYVKHLEFHGGFNKDIYKQLSDEELEKDFKYFQQMTKRQDRKNHRELIE